MPNTKTMNCCRDPNNGIAQQAQVCRPTSCPLAPTSMARFKFPGYDVIIVQRHHLHDAAHAGVLGANQTLFRHQSGCTTNASRNISWSTKAFSIEVSNNTP